MELCSTIILRISSYKDVSLVKKIDKLYNVYSSKYLVFAIEYKQTLVKIFTQ